jgi:hypothetical protein
VKDLTEFVLSNGELPLRWKSEFLEKPVLRHATGDGPQETHLTKQQFGPAYAKFLPLQVILVNWQLFIACDET